MKREADKGIREFTFKVGDWVLVKLTTNRQLTLASNLHHKLKQKFYGPFQISHKINDVAYTMSLPKNCKIHPTFHISKLKGFKGEVPQDLKVNLPPVSIRNEVVSTPIASVDYREISRMGQRVPQLLVHWAGTPLEDITWEDLKSMQSLLPSLQLEDKLSLEELSHDSIHLDEDLVVKNLQKHIQEIQNMVEEKELTKISNELSVEEVNEISKEAASSSGIHKLESARDSSGVQAINKNRPDSSVETAKTVELEGEIAVCELKKNMKDTREETSVTTESRPIRSKRALARFKDSIMF